MRLYHQIPGPLAAERLSTEPALHADAHVLSARLGRYTEIGPRTVFHHSAMDDYSYIVNDGEVIWAEIGKFCSIAAHVRINPGNHPMWRASQSHFTYRSELYWPGAGNDETVFAWRRAHGIRIGHDVWIGHGAIILPGASIGTGAVIAAGAVVTKPVADYTIMAGVPAQPVKRRFRDDVAQRLMAIAWWDWSHGKLRDALGDFRSLNVEQFIEKYG